MPLEDIGDSKDTIGMPSRSVTGTISAKEVVEAVNNKAFDNTEAINIFNINMSEKSDQYYCTVKQFEDDIMAIEDIRVYVRAATNATIRKYNHKKQYGNDNTVVSFMKRLSRETSSMYTFEIPGWDRSEKMTIESLKNIQSIFIQEKQLIS